MNRYEAIKGNLLALAEPEYAEFAAHLLRKPNEKQPAGTAAHVLGIRLPKLRKLAGVLAKEGWRESLEALAAYGVEQISDSDKAGMGNCEREPEKRLSASGEERCFEEVMLWGFLIGKAKIRKCAETDELNSGRTKAGHGDIAARSPRRKRSGQEEITLEEQFALIRDFVSQIDNWSLCDSFCAGLKFTLEYPEETWEFLQPFLRSEEEYAVRFGVVMLLNYFIMETYIDRLFPVFDAIKQDGYYVKMAVAWAISMCYVKFPEKTENYLAHNTLDDFTFHKALQKIAESRCVSEEVRRRIRMMRRDKF